MNDRLKREAKFFFWCLLWAGLALFAVALLPFISIGRLAATTAKNIDTVKIKPMLTERK